MKTDLPNFFTSYLTDGICLVELLVATCILSVGLLGIGGIYLKNFQKMKFLSNYTLANLQLISSMEAIPLFKEGLSIMQPEVEKALPSGSIKLENHQLKICWFENQTQHCVTNES